MSTLCHDTGEPHQYINMDIACIPNMTGLHIEHLIDPAGPGEKTEWLDFSKIDYNDKREVPLSWKRIKTFDEGLLVVFQGMRREIPGRDYPLFGPEIH